MMEITEPIVVGVANLWHKTILQAKLQHGWVKVNNYNGITEASSGSIYL